jgi:hypothetical protein
VRETTPGRDLVLTCPGLRHVDYRILALLVPAVMVLYEWSWESRSALVIEENLCEPDPAEPAGRVCLSREVVGMVASKLRVDQAADTGADTGVGRLLVDTPSFCY